MGKNIVIFRKLGSSSLNVSPICFGGNVFGWTVNESDSYRILDKFVDSGFNFIDTADMYSRWVPENRGGESETIIGNWLQKRGGREKVIIATKFGMEMGPDKVGLSKRYMATAVEDSLRRLQTDYIDLYQSHKDDENTPVTETLEGYQKLIEDGKVREIGASNFSSTRLKEAIDASTNGLPRYQTLQPRYSLVEREEFEKELEQLTQDENIGVISYFSLASGFLTGKYKSEQDLSGRPRGPGVQKYLNEQGFRVISALHDVADRHAVKVGQVAIAWLLARPSVTAPIVSATSVQQLQELIETIDITLTDEDIKEIDASSAF